MLYYLGGAQNSLNLLAYLTRKQQCTRGHVYNHESTYQQKLVPKTSKYREYWALCLLRVLGSTRRVLRVSLLECLDVSCSLRSRSWSYSAAALPTLACTGFGLRAKVF